MPRASHGGCGPGCAPTAPRRMTGDAARTGPRSRLFPELRRPPSDGGGNALGCDDVAELPAEFRLRRIERADDVEPGVKRSAEAGRVGPAIDGALRRVERLPRHHRHPLRIPPALPPPPLPRPHP